MSDIHGTRDELVAFIAELRAEIERWKLTVALRDAEIERLNALLERCGPLGDMS